MGRYLMTHSLLASWLYTMKENPYEDMTTERDPMGEFMQTLRREPTPTTEAMQNGIKFEDMVTDIINGRADPNDPWYAAAEKVARRCAGGVLQYKAKKIVEVGGMSLLLYEKQAQPDYKGTIKGGRTVMFEAKFTAADRMEQSRVLQSQQDYMDRHQALGARCFVIAGFSSGMVYCVPWDIWKTMKDHFGRKYVTEADLEKYQVQTAWNGTLLLLN